jgi:hypothetical protein
MRSALSFVAIAMVAGALACGGGGSSGGSGGSCTPGSTASMTLTSSGVSPKAVCVLPGGTVTFTNNDAAAHDIEGSGCTELNLGPIAPAASKSATFPTSETCTFHDAGSPSNAAFQGTVAVTSAPASGPGY